jgi:hypothetical protein
VFAGDHARSSSGSASLDAKRQAHEARQLAEAAAVIDEGLAAVREAMAKYADPKNWRNDDWGVTSIIIDEYGFPGKAAAAALAALTPTPEAKP